MEHEWNPSGYYLIDEYLNDLDSRAAIGEAISQAPPELKTKLSSLLDRLDNRFVQSTVNDGGAEFSRWKRRKPTDIPAWLWERVPARIPWDR